MNYEIAKTSDGSNTYFSKEYNQHYHDIKEGAIKESLSKHIIPSIEYSKNKEKLIILDICFGLGYNTFSLLYYLKKNNINKKLHIISPELDCELIKKLEDFEYPKEFDFLKDIIKEVSQKCFYEDENLKIEIKIGDAREYLKSCDEKFDIVFQDAFSSEVNKELWTKQYFELIYNVFKEDAILTTYSIATPVRLSMSENGFFIHEARASEKRRITLAFKKIQDNYKYIDMELKKLRNKEAKPLLD